MTTVFIINLGSEASSMPLFSLVNLIMLVGICEAVLRILVIALLDELAVLRIILWNALNVAFQLV